MHASKSQPKNAQRQRRQEDISKTSPGSDDKARCVVVCCDTNTAVWHEWKCGWNAGGWGSKSYFEVTCGATNAMEVCQSSAISCPSFASPPESELTPPVPTMSQKHQQHRHPHAAQRDVYRFITGISSHSEDHRENATRSGKQSEIGPSSHPKEITR